MSSFEWSALLRAGVQGAGLKPAEFWALTPYELSVMLGVETRQTPLTRVRLMELDARFGGAKGEGDD